MIFRINTFISNWVGEIYDKEQTMKQTSPNIFLSFIITSKIINIAKVNKDNIIVYIKACVLFSFPYKLKNQYPYKRY